MLIDLQREAQRGVRGLDRGVAGRDVPAGAELASLLSDFRAITSTQG